MDRQIDELTHRVRERTGNRLELMIVDDDHVASLAIAADPLTVSPRQDAVTLVGRDLPQLLTQAEDAGRTAA